MTPKRFCPAATAIFLFALLWNALVHLLILREANSVLATFARPAAERGLVLSLVQTAALSVVFLFTYLQSRYAGRLRGGLVHGVLFAVIAGLLVELNQYILYPIPGRLVVAWFAFGLVEFCVYGLLAALLCRVETTGGTTGANNDDGTPG